MDAPTARSGFSVQALDIERLADEYLASLDIAEVNLACAKGLPGAENLDSGRLLDWLDEAARAVDLETRRHWAAFTPSHPCYKGSPGYYCCYWLLRVLQEDFGVRYNPARVRDPSFQDPKCLEPDFRDSRDLFIHGIIDGPGGTCASMPVLYVAVGRRLGYPLKLVQSRGHLFFRWDDPWGTRFNVPESINIEGTGDGIGSYPDEHYRNWPEPWTQTDIMGGWFLRSLTPREELAAFLCQRGDCLTDNGRHDEAIHTCLQVCGLMPHDLRYLSQLANLLRRSHQALIEAQRMLVYNLAAVSAHRPGPAIGSVAVPPHGDSCQCFHCRQARDTANRRPAIGHPQHCLCPLCRGPLPGVPLGDGRLFG